MRLIIMFIAIALAAGAFFIAMHFTATPPRDPQLPVVRPEVQVRETPTVDIYTAKQDIPVGTVIKQELLDLQPWPKNLVLPDMVVAESPHPGDIVKMIARTPFAKGEPIVLNRLANENDPSFLASSLGEGMRLITIAVDVVSGVGGFVFPGDRVDVLVTHDVPVDSVIVPENAGDPASASVYNGVGNNGVVSPLHAAGQGVSSAMNNAGNALGGRAPASVPGSLHGNSPEAQGPLSVLPKKEMVKKQITEVLVSNVRVLAANQKSTAHGGDAPVVPSNISIEVSSADAQKIRLSESGNGRLSLALRSLKDKGVDAASVMPTAVPDLSAYKEIPASGVSAVVIVRGIHAEAVEVSKP